MIMSACRTSTTLETSSMSLDEFKAAEIHIEDTLYIPWQMWREDSAPPLAIARHTAARKQQNRNLEQRDTAAKVQDITVFGNANKRRTSGSSSVRLIILLALVLGLILVVRRR